MLNVHIFDGKLCGLFKPFQTYTLLQKQQLFQELISSYLKNNLAIQMVQMITQDMLHDHTQGQNIQIENQLDCTEILADILVHANPSDSIPLISEQLEDMRRLGTCASGRCTRLLQIWLAFFGS